jgi:MarR family transcriptional regulator, 2-MHQ and catechol-resistance regulon repressor
MRREHQGNEKEVIALSTYVKLVRAVESITSRIHKHLASAGLTLSQFAVLEALYHLGPLYQREIGQKLLRSSGNITMVIDNLEKRGYVKRERKQEDRRFMMVRLTDEGSENIRRVFPPHAAVIAREMSILSASEQKTLAQLCKKLGLRKRK